MNKPMVTLSPVFLLTTLLFTTQLLCAQSHTAIAAEENTTAAIERWQLQMIYQPTPSLIKREDKGFVNIYDGFTDVQVDTILDDKFDRIDHMMFSRIKVTDIDGAVKTDPETGYAIVEDDGCE